MTIRDRWIRAAASRASSERLTAWVGLLSVCVLLAVALQPAHAAQTTIHHNSETSVDQPGGIMDQLYGLGNVTRVEDFSSSPTDQVWFQVTSGLATATARYAGLTHRFGFFDGTGATFTQLFQVSGSTQGLLVSGPSAVFGVTNPTFRFGLQVVSGSTVTNTWSSQQSENTDGAKDHLVVWRIAGPGDRYALAWEDLAIGSPPPEAGEPDYNDLVIEVSGMAPYGCGNGTIDPGEQCDDGNTVGGDCCSITCQAATIGSSCADSNFCNGSETCQAGGVCAAGTPPVCNDGNACTSDSCNPTAGCQTAALTNGTSCADSDLCNGAETCQAGMCSAGTPLGCNDGNACTSDSCNPTLGCQAAPVANDTPCLDGNLCNGAESCQAGTCSAGTPLGCNDGNACTSDSCNPTLGCQAAPVANGTPCLDSNLCNGAETCQSGTCSAGTPLSCDDQNACTDDSCSPLSGCETVPNTASCSDDNACTVDDICAAGVCTPGASLACNDGNVCTDDSCNPSSGCEATPNTAACDDSSACTIGDSCAAGACVSGQPLVCDDANSCTVDSCEAATGCQHVNDPNVCAPATESIQPIVECVEEHGPGDFTAHFGYLNANSAPVPIPVGADNEFGPAPIDRGQTTLFAPGRSPFFPATAFQVDFDGTSLTWTVRSPNGTTLATMASSSSARCPTPPSVLRQHSICYGVANLDGSPMIEDLPLQSIEDSFEWRTFSLKGKRQLCAPAQVTFDGQVHLVIDPQTHQMGRQLTLAPTKPPQPAIDPRNPANQNIQVDDDFGSRRIDITRVDRELMPAAVCNPATQTCPSDPGALSLLGIDSEEYKCYRARASAGSPKFPKGVNVVGVDPFQSRVYRVTGPKLLCTRANREGDDPAAVAATEGRVCYGLTVPTSYCEPGSPAPFALARCHKRADCGGSRCLALPRPVLNKWVLGVRTRMEEGSQIVTVLYPTLLCVPAEITR